MSEVSMRDMLAAGVHFGHQTRYWNPKMAPYLFGHRQRMHIINLEHSLPMYRDAMNFLGSEARKRSCILFVGTKRPAQRIVREEAERCGMPYVNRRWLGGLLTNFKTVSSSVKRLKELEAMQQEGGMVGLTKKEALSVVREMEKLNASLAGIKNMERLPNILFVVDTGYESIAVSEAKKLGIPVVGVVDSNNAPDHVDHVIPGNDDAIRAIKLYCKGAADAVLEAQATLAALNEQEADEFVELDADGNPVPVAARATGSNADNGGHADKETNNADD